MFPAQFYILAELKPGTINREGANIDFAGVTFYVCTGRSLDEGGAVDSVNFKQFTSLSHACSYDKIPEVLNELIKTEYEEVATRMRSPRTGENWHRTVF